MMHDNLWEASDCKSLVMVETENGVFDRVVILANAVNIAIFDPVTNAKLGVITFDDISDYYIYD
jgi:hypothetical protein